MAALIRRRPEVIGLAKRNLQDWTTHWGRLTPAWEEWTQAVLLARLRIATEATDVPL